MDDNKALGIVSALANGVNPLTGEIFPAGSPYQAPEIVRALYAAARALDSGGGQRQRSPSRDLPSNAGKQWTKDEEQQLLTEFDRGRTPSELALSHGRTLAGIEARLEKHGRLSPADRQTSNRYTANREGGNGSSNARPPSR